MKKQITYHERGQALILIVFAAIGLFAFTALAIDGGRVFSDRRHSQNASDTAVLAGALERIRLHTGVNWEDVAKQRASDNGYSNNVETEVDTYLCSDLPKTAPDGYVMTCKGLPDGPNADTDPTHYIYVHIKSVVHLLFAPVIGWQTVTNHTDAVAHAGIPVPTTWYDGYGIASVGEGCPAPGDGDPFEVAGNAENYVIGAGVLVNSNCNPAFVQNGTSSSLDVTTTICVNGTANYNSGDITSGTSPAVTTGCSPIDPSMYQLPNDPTCDKNGYLEDKGGGVWIAQPGNYDMTGNKQFPDVSGQATVILTKGIYCLYNGINVNAGTTLTTDFNGNGDFDPSIEGVLFYLPGQENGDDITFNGGADIHVHAISSKPGDWFDDSWLNLLIYVKPPYDPTIDISGNAGSTFTGTILAPSAHVVLGGSNSTTAGTVTLDSQIIADTVKLTGSTDFKLYYNESNNATTLTNPDMSVIE